MNKIKRYFKAHWTITLAVSLCLVALTVFGGFQPTVSANNPQDCVYADQHYSEGACRDGQRCVNGQWLNGCN